MFVGHYGVSFAARRPSPGSVWVLFIAVQLLDVLWAPFVLLGIEKVRIVPGITASNPLDPYYMPYTHGLLAAIAVGRGVSGVSIRGPGGSDARRGHCGPRPSFRTGCSTSWCTGPICRSTNNTAK